MKAKHRNRARFQINVRNIMKCAHNPFAFLILPLQTHVLPRRGVKKKRITCVSPAPLSLIILSLHRHIAKARSLSSSENTRTAQQSTTQRSIVECSFNCFRGPYDILLHPVSALDVIYVDIEFSMIILSSWRVFLKK